MRYSDHIAYINHDIDDAERAGLLTEEDIPLEIREVLGNSKSERITTLIDDLVDNFDGDFGYSETVNEKYRMLKDYMYEKIYLNTSGAAKREEIKVAGLIGGLWEKYVKDPSLMPEACRIIAEEEGAERAAADYISGMSDDFAVFCYEEFFIPKGWAVK